MRTLKEDIGLTGLFISVEGKITGVHFQGLINLVNVGIRAFQFVGFQNAEKLANLARHDFEPHDVFTVFSQ